MTPRQSLARTITDQTQVLAMTDEALDAAIAGHEAEILSLEGRIAAADDPDRTQPAQRALKVLKLHLRWLEREHRRRDQIANTVNRALNRESAERVQRDAIAAKQARVAKAYDDNTRSIEVFKEVAREVLGAEFYAHLWELVRLRTANETQKGST